MRSARPSNVLRSSGHDPPNKRPIAKAETFLTGVFVLVLSAVRDGTVGFGRPNRQELHRTQGLAGRQTTADNPRPTYQSRIASRSTTRIHPIDFRYVHALSFCTLRRYLETPHRILSHRHRPGRWSARLSMMATSPCFHSIEEYFGKIMPLLSGDLRHFAKFRLFWGLGTAEMRTRVRRFSFWKILFKLFKCIYIFSLQLNFSWHQFER